MKMAISLFKGGELIDAETIQESSISYLRLACPECLESVILIRRLNYANHFSHYPRKDKSPFCMLRTESYGRLSSESICRDRIRILLDRDIFQKAILFTFAIKGSPPLTDLTSSELAPLLNSMQELMAMKDRCITSADLHLPVKEYSSVRSTVEQIILARSTSAALEKAIQQESQKQAEHLTSVRLLWEQLHLQQSEKDLRFLLDVACHLLASSGTRSGVDWPSIRRKGDSEFAFFLVCASQAILMQVPWLHVEMFLEMAALPIPVNVSNQCGICGREVHTPRNGVVPKCDDCGKVLCLACRNRCEKCNIYVCKEHAALHKNFGCPDCGQGYCETRSYGDPDYCFICGERICAECYHYCECCSEAFCDDCYHEEYTCESCGEVFCDNHPDGIGRRDCPACDKSYCEICAESAIRKCSKCAAEICEGCLETCSTCHEEFCETCIDVHICTS